MRKKSNKVYLSIEQRNELIKTVKSRIHSAEKIRRANILLLLDENNGPVKMQTEITEMSKKFADIGLKSIERKKRKNPPIMPIVTGEVEAHIIAISCSAPPEGHKHWTLSLTAERLIELNVVPTISKDTVGRALKNELKPHRNKYWCIPPKENAAFVAAMENILYIYQRPYNPKIPVICMDEKPYQLLDEKLKPLPVKPKSVKKTDSEYVRNGTCSIFVLLSH